MGTGRTRGKKGRQERKKTAKFSAAGESWGDGRRLVTSESSSYQPTLSLCLSRLDFCSVCPVSTAVRFAGRREPLRKKNTTNNNSAHSCTFILQPQLTNHSTAFRLKKSQQYSEPSPPHDRNTQPSTFRLPHHSCILQSCIVFNRTFRSHHFTFLFLNNSSLLHQRHTSCLEARESLPGVRARAARRVLATIRRSR